MYTEHSLHLPRVAILNVKTAITTAFCALIYLLIGRSPAFACIGVIFGCGASWADSYKNGGNRLYGTLIGGLLGMALFRIYLIFVPDGHPTPLLVLVTLVGTLVLIWLCNCFWPGGVQPGGVVLCILLFNTPVETYIAYALNRILDTSLGVLLAWGTCWLWPQSCRKVWHNRIEHYHETHPAHPCHSCQHCHHHFKHHG